MKKPEKVASDILELAGFTPDMIKMAIHGDSGKWKRFSGFSSQYPSCMIDECAKIFLGMDYKYSRMKNRSEVGFKYLTGSWTRLRDNFQFQKVGDFHPKWDDKKQTLYTLYAGQIEERPIFISFEKGRECQGGYAGVCTETHRDAFNFANYVLRQCPDLDFKDMDVFHNVLGGLSWNDLEQNDVKPFIIELLKDVA